MSPTSTPAPAVTLDQAMQNAKTTEATYVADSINVTNIEAQIAQATSPLESAQETVANDVTAFNDALDVLSQTALASKIPVSGS